MTVVYQTIQLCLLRLLILWSSSVSCVVFQSSLLISILVFVQHQLCIQ